MAYAVVLRPRARKALRRLDPTVATNVAAAIDALADNPRPEEATPLKGHHPYLRVRVGAYRVIYTIDDNERLVVVAVVGHRREAYRRF